VLVLIFVKNYEISFALQKLMDKISNLAKYRMGGGNNAIERSH